MGHLAAQDEKAVVFLYSTNLGKHPNWLKVFFDFSIFFVFLTGLLQVA